MHSKKIINGNRASGWCGERALADASRRCELDGAGVQLESRSGSVADATRVSGL
jgi:hypothetical protein